MNISKEIYENVEFEPIADDRLDSTFTVIGENGEETVCEILFTYHDDNTNKDYIVYTDNSIDNEVIQESLPQYSILMRKILFCIQ